MYITKIPFEAKLINNSVRKNRKEHKYTESLLLLGVTESGNIKVLIDSRYYRTKVNAYCCVWIYLNDFFISGGGVAGGYGYHKKSASLENALNNAGVGVKNLGDSGESAMESCLIELGRKANAQFNLGLSNFKVINAYG